jgi:L-cysteine:1D-myo-inositol 2-amino-2-deoxy-alpha-D-glucopyranoside ligase
VPLEVTGRARLYVCGITPYDATHLGHAATYVAFDLLHRQWLDQGIEVTYAQNVTDVDDPLLERAAATGEPWTDLAAREIELFREDMHALRILPPQHFVGVVESLSQVADLVTRLDAAVYPVGDDLYLDVRADEDFGSLAALTDAEMLAYFAERGGDPDRTGKRDPLDCLVWRAPQTGEPSWDTDIGAGRPGWHVECAAIGLRYLGTEFDVQGGGSDLLFPHHEMCASHVRLATGRSAARVHMHAGMVAFQGEKMSKSLGNLVLVSELRAHDPAAIRLALLAHHYRSDWEWTDRDLPYAEARLTRWRAALNRSTHPPTEPLIARVRAELGNDLNAPAALAAMDAWCASAGTATDASGVRDAIDALLGVAL